MDPTKIPPSTKKAPSFQEKNEQSRWNSRSIQHFQEKFYQLAETIMTSADENYPLSQKESETKKLLKKIVTLVHTLDEPLSREDNISIINARKVLSSEFAKIQKKIHDKIPSLESNIIQLRHENHQSLEGLQCLVKDHDFECLYRLVTNEKLAKNVSQIQVLSQYDDGTISGFENCGYHALKNALLLLISEKNGNEWSKLFNDKQLFYTFYSQYCLPILEDMGVKAGNKDASVLVLRQIIQTMAIDPHPPQSLLFLQKTLAQAQEDQSLVILQIASTRNDAHSPPFFAFFDAAGSLEAKKGIVFAMQKGPATLSCICGNEDMGHWYTMTIHKTHEGKLFFIGCDSMDNNHATLGPFSPLGKLSQLFLEKMENPYSFAREAYEPIQESLSRMASSFYPDGSLPKDFEKQWLDATPVSDLAIAKIHNGSMLERKIVECIEAYTFLQSMDWIGSQNYWIYLQVNDLKLIVDFYAKKLPAKHPFAKKMQEISAEIKTKHPTNIIDTKIAEALADLELEKKNKRITEFEYQQAQSTFSMMHTLYHEKKNLSKVSDETARNNQMNDLKDVRGIEAGFTLGKNSIDIENSLIQKMNTLLLAYQEKKNQGDFISLIRTIASGDGCLTARISRVMTLYASLQGLGKIEEEAQTEKIAEAPTYIFSETLAILAEKYIEEREEAHIHEMSEIDEASSTEFVNKIQDYAVGEIGKPFRTFLVDTGIIQRDPSIKEIPEADQIDWLGIHPQIMDRKKEILAFLQEHRKQHFSIEEKGWIANASIDKLKTQENLEILISQFASFSNAAQALPFREYLAKKGIVAQADGIDWEETVPKMFALPEFSVWLNQGKAQALSLL